AIIYIWMRLFEESGRFSAASGLVGICSTIAIIALPFQFWTLAHSYGRPIPWLQLFAPTMLRPSLYWPGLIVIGALALAAISRGITKHWNGRAGRSGPCASNAARCPAGR